MGIEKSKYICTGALICGTSECVHSKSHDTNSACELGACIRGLYKRRDGLEYFRIKCTRVRDKSLAYGIRTCHHPNPPKIKVKCIKIPQKKMSMTAEEKIEAVKLILEREPASMYSVTSAWVIINDIDAIINLE